MLTAVRSTKPTNNQVLCGCILLLLTISSLSLAGCAGLVGSSSPNTPAPSSLAITNVQATSATMSGFQVGWATNVPANSGVDYGTTTAYGSSAPANSSLVTSHQVALSGLKPGTMYHFRARSTDSSGNSVTSVDMTSTTVADTVAPSVSVTSPAANATLSGTVNVTATASDNVAVASVQFKVDGANTGAAITSAPYAYSLNTTTLSNGNHVLTAIATDTSNNSATSASVSVAVSNTASPDTTPPTISITAPASGASVSGTVSVSANATDNVGVASVQFQLDGANLGALDTATPYTTSWNTTTTSNGAHTLTAIAKDAAGNSTTSASVTVTVNNGAPDATPPTVSITAPANGASLSGTVTVTANASDNVGVASVQFQLDGANLGSLDTTSPYSISWDTSGTSNGSHALTATAKDAAGNSATSATVTVSVSNSTPPPPSGSNITSFQLSSSVGGTLPFTVGLGFKKGDAVPGSVSLNLSNQQIVVKAKWNDGSVKTAIASGRVALTAGVAKAINVVAATGTSGTAKTCADIQTAAPSASVQLGAIGTVNLSSLLATPFRTWVSGSEMVECHYRSNVGSDTTLQVWFHVRLYADGRVWVRTVVENGYIDVSTANKSYIPTVIVGGATIFTNGGVSMTHFANTRWVQEGWIGGDPQLTVQHDARYLEATKLLPNYMNQTPSATALNGLCQTYTYQNNCGWSATMGDTGFQNQIGLLPLWDALYATSNADVRAWKSVQANAKALNSYPIVWNDSATHLPVRPTDRPTYSFEGAGGGGATSLGAGTLSFDVAHHGSGGYLAYIITGDYFYLDTLEDLASMCYVMNSSGNGSGVNRSLRGVVQSRGEAWCMRTVSQLAGVAPTGDAIGNDYRTLLANSAADFNTVAQAATSIGYIMCYEECGGAYDPAHGVLAPWQENFLEQSVGMGRDIEPLADLTTWNALDAHIAQGAVGPLGPNGSSFFCFNKGADFNRQVSDTVTNSPSLWYPDWGTVWTKNNGSPNTSCGNTLVGNSGSDPGVASTGYWGNLIPAIAYAVDHGATGAAASWTRLTGATNWNTVLNSGFGDIPNWGIIPRSASSTPPPPPPATVVSVTAPTAGATVSGTTNVVAAASSGNGIAGVQFQVDSANLGAEVTTSPYSQSWNTAIITDGVHFLAAVARDSQGNLTVSPSVSVNVSNVATTNPPLITAVASVPAASSVVITWTTDKPATSQVDYGATTAYGSQTPAVATLVTAHSVAVTGLTASTTYHFRVRSTDAGGNTAVSADFSFTTPAPSGTAIPPTLGWFQPPNTNFRPHCPAYTDIQANTGCAAVMSAWSGGLYDAKRDRFIVTGGGHLDYFGNEMYAVNLNANPITVTLAQDASHGASIAGVNNCPEGYADGTMSSRHTYDGAVYLSSKDLYLFHGGGLPGPCGALSSSVWTFNPNTSAWSQDSTGGGPADGANGSLPMAAYDPITDAVYEVENNVTNFWRYNISLHTWTNLSSPGLVCQGNGITAAIDPGRRFYFCIGGGAFSKVSLNAPFAASNVTGTGCSALRNAAAPGFVFDSKQNLLVGWAGGNSVYTYNPDTDSCTTQTFTGGPTTIQGNGTFGRFQYSPNLNVFVVTNDLDSGVYTLRLTP